MHGLIFALWPQMQQVLQKPVIVEGELVAPRTEEPPPIVIPPPPLHDPPPPEPLPPEPRSTPRPDPGVALPVLSAKQEVSDNTPADYVVAEAAPLKPGEDIPFGSSVGTTALESYTPGDVVADAGAEGDGRDSEDDVDRGVLSGFGDALRERASQFGSYPVIAQRRGWQGRVKVRVRYDRKGEAYQIDLLDSSGHQVLDEQALKMVTKASRDISLPEALVKKAFSVIVPIDFKMN